MKSYISCILFCCVLSLQTATLCEEAKLSYTYELAVCAIFRNEARFMREWIEFHKLMGVQHFYLYNNESDDNYLNVLKPYIKQGTVTLTDWTDMVVKSIRPLTNEAYEDTCFEGFSEDFATGSRLTVSNQIAAYNHCLKSVESKVKWLAVIDLDEFLFPVQKNNLLEFLKDYEEFGGVCANWVMFGTSDVTKVQPNELLTERLVRSGGIANHFIKTIVRPERIDCLAGPHHAKYKANFFCVNQDYLKATSSTLSHGKTDKLRINHYWTGDIERFFTVKILNTMTFLTSGNHVLWTGNAKNFSSLPLPNTPTWKSENADFFRKFLAIKCCFDVAESMNKTVDLTIHKYLPQLKERMAL